jgi:hypothetical protein
VPYKVFEAVMTALGFSVSRMGRLGIKEAKIEFELNSMSKADIAPFKSVLLDAYGYSKSLIESHGYQVVVSGEKIVITQPSAVTDTAVEQNATAH